MANSYYGIDSNNGNQLTVGLSPEHYARQVAQRMANERGESVYLYAVPSEGDAEEIAPEEE